MELPFAGLHQLCAPMLDRLDALPEPQRDALRDRVRALRRRRPGPVPGRPGRAQPAGRGGRGAAAALRGRRRAVAGCGLGAGPGFVARRLLAESVGDRVRGPRAERRAELRRPAGARSSQGSATRTRAPCWRSVDPGPARRAGARPDRRRDAGQPAGAAGAAAGLTPARAGRRVRAAGGAARCRADRGELPAAARGAAGRRAAAAAGRGGRAGRRPAAAAGARPSGSGSAPTAADARRADGLLAIGERVTVPASAGALGGLPVGVGARSAARCIWRWPRRPIATPTPTGGPGTWPPRPRARRGRRRRARALGRPGAGARRPRRGGGVPAARGRADAPTRRGGPTARWPPPRPACEAGAFDAAAGCWPTAEAGPLDELQRARVDLLRAEVAYSESRGSDAPPLLLRAAKTLEPLDPQLARETYLDAWGAALFAGRSGEHRRACTRSRARPRGPAPVARSAAVRSAAGRLRAAVHRRARRGGAGARAGGDAASPASDVSDRGGPALGVARDRGRRDGVGLRDLSSRSRRAGSSWPARPGALTVLAVGVNVTGAGGRARRRVRKAALLVAEAEAVTEATGARVAPYGALVLAGLPGREAEAAGLIDATIEEPPPAAREPRSSTRAGRRSVSSTVSAATRRRSRRPGRRATTRRSCSSPCGRAIELIEAAPGAARPSWRARRSSASRRPRPRAHRLGARASRRARARC